jgi:hypothetical protein
MFETCQTQTIGNRDPAAFLYEVNHLRFIRARQAAIVN